MAIFSKLTRDRWSRFRRIKRAWYSFCYSLGSVLSFLVFEILCNDKPYIMSYNENGIFRFFQFYSKRIWWKYLTEADYLALRNSPSLKMVIIGWFFHLSHIVPYIHTSTSQVRPLIHPLPIIGWVPILLQGMCLPVCYMDFVYVCSFL